MLAYVHIINVSQKAAAICTSTLAELVSHLSPPFTLVLVPLVDIGLLDLTGDVPMTEFTSLI